QVLENHRRVARYVAGVAVVGRGVPVIGLAEHGEVALQAEDAATDHLITRESAGLQVGAAAIEIEVVGAPVWVEGRAAVKRKAGRAIGVHLTLDARSVASREERIVDADI